MKRLLLTLTACLLLGVIVVGQGTLSSQVLQLLTRTNSWTAANTFLDFRLIKGVPSDTALRLYVDSSGTLYFNGSIVTNAGGGVGPHNLLSTTHLDTLAGSVARGAVIVGNATPAWAAVTVGAAGSVLRSDGTDTAFSTNGSGLTSLTAANISAGTAGISITGNAATATSATTAATVTGATQASITSAANLATVGTITSGTWSGLFGAVSGANLITLNATNLGSGTVPLARLSGITNTEVAAGAAVAYSKLNLTGGIVNADVSGSAAIAYSKLALTGSVVTGDLASATLLFNRWASNSCTSLQVPQYNGSAWVCKSLAVADITAGGTVTSAALALPAIFTVSGSPVTTSGTLTGTLATQTANTIWAGPTTGAAAAPTFRVMVNADLPLSGVSAGTYAKVTLNTAGVATAASAQITLTTDVTGVLPMANGGTGVSVSADDTLLVGSGTAWVAQTLPNCVTGGLNYTTATNAWSCNTTGITHAMLSTTHSDSLAAAVARGAIIVGNSTPAWARVLVGTAGQLVHTDGTDTAWSNTIARGTITTSTPWTFTQTWNDGAVTFKGIVENITSTASAAASLLLDLQVGGTSQFTVSKAGVLASVGSYTPTVAGAANLGTAALPFGSVVLGTAATNNLTVTPAAFAQGTVATVSDPGFTTASLSLTKRGTIAYTGGALTTGTCSAAVTATVTGLATTSVINASHNAVPGAQWLTGIYFLAYPTANTVNIIVCNPTAGTITPNSATFNYEAVVP